MPKTLRMRSPDASAAHAGAAPGEGLISGNFGAFPAVASPLNAERESGRAAWRKAGSPEAVHQLCATAQHQQPHGPCAA